MAFYSGYRTEYGLKLVVLGDGSTKQIKIDLSKEPFAINFQGNYPKSVFVRSDDSSVPVPDIAITSATLTLDYSEALPPTGEGTLSPRSQLDVYLLFAPAITE